MVINRTLNASALALFAAMVLTASARADSPQPEKRMLPMADGVELATDIYKPDKGEGPWPVRLVRTPYGRTRYGNEYGSQARYGYVMVLQDMRGRFDSQGKDIAFANCGWEAPSDGMTTIEWIRQQSWCNGKIGTEGASAMGITQYMLGGASPRVDAQYILVASPSLYHHATYPNGALRASLVVGWLTDNAFDPENIWFMGAHPFYDKHWQGFDSIARVEQCNVPAVHFGGWYDVFQQGTIDGFVARHNQGGEGAKGKQKLIIGPWAHGGPNNRPVGEVTFPKNSQTLPHACGGREWFDYYLKGKDTGIENVPAVQYYTMGALGPGEENAPGNKWRSADNWPVPAEPTPFYFHADGGLTAEPPATADAKRAYDYHPYKPVPTRGGCLLVLPSGPYDQRDLEQRPDVITFTTPPLEAPVEVTGRLIAKLVITSNRLDTDFAVKLTDVYPDGTSLLIADGLARCRARKGVDRIALLEPGKPTEIKVDLWSTSMVFNKGHRIRVAVTSSNYPKYDVNVNTGWPGVPLAPVLPAHNEILCSKAHASHIVLPIVK